MDKHKMIQSLRERLSTGRQVNTRLCRHKREYLGRIVSVIREFQVEKIVLFGSITEPERFGAHSDIDIGLIGINKEDFFKIYNRLSLEIDWPIDLVDLDGDAAFKDMILARGETIYDRGKTEN